jgi:hypothetical protein
MSQDERDGPIERIKEKLGLGSGDEVDPIELERLSLVDTTDSDRSDAPAGTGQELDELPPDLRETGKK